MNTTVKALLDLYVKLGGKLTDAYDGIADGTSVGSFTKIPDCIEACVQVVTSGGGETEIAVVANPSSLSATAENGSVAVALADDATDTVTYPTQTADEEVSVDIAGKSVAFGSPTFDGTAIAAAITANDLPQGEIVDVGVGSVDVVVVPSVADASSNAYVTAGMTLDADTIIVASGATKDYAVGIRFTPDLVNPDKIVPVDSSHVKLPFMAILAFEALSGTVYGLENESLTTGWNVAIATVDTATYSDISAIEIVTDININEYVAIVPQDTNTMTIEGTSGVDLFKNILVGATGAPKGLYVRLSNAWNHCAMD